MPHTQAGRHIHTQLTIPLLPWLLFALYYQALTGDCGFLAANLYARSIFGEDALANLSIEKVVGAGDKTSVQGHVRIRAKTQVSCGCVCGCGPVYCCLYYVVREWHLVWVTRSISLRRCPLQCLQMDLLLLLVPSFAGTDRLKLDTNEL